MATSTFEEEKVRRRIKHLNDSINYALQDIAEIDVQGKNTVLLQTSYVNQLPKIRACAAHLKDAQRSISGIKY